MAEPFIAQVQAFGCYYTVRGWSPCSGQILSIAQNTTLFALIGTIYGGNGNSTMQLPNMQGRVPIHPGVGPGRAPRQLGERSGVEQVALYYGNVPQHDHGGNILVETGSGTVVDNPIDNYLPVGQYIAGPGPTRMGGTTKPSSPAGGSQPHGNMMPFSVLNYCIALQGMFPSRN